METKALKVAYKRSLLSVLNDVTHVIDDVIWVE